ncbi:MAG TPA: hypothetical protein VJZ04_09120 [Lachnospiraceae bacterium]|nr:hypothetical protein [Lachnospiraceae bacterium]
MKRKISSVLIMIILCLCLCGFVSKGEQRDYSLTVIGEETIPLVSSIETNSFFPKTIFFMGIMLVTFFSVIYIAECRRYRKRIFDLSKIEWEQSATVSLNWNLPTLKQRVKETENRIADQLLE